VPAVDKTSGNDGATAGDRPAGWPPEQSLNEVPNEVGDDRNDILPNDRVLLIVENDQAFSRILLETAREMGFKGLVTSMGATALTMVREFKPHAISLDINLPDIDGWRILDRLKNDLSTRHIPVCVVSTDESRGWAFAAGAYLFLAKPLQNRHALERMLERVNDFLVRKTHTIVVHEPDVAQHDAWKEALSGDNVNLSVSAETESIASLLGGRKVDCLITTAPTPDLWKELQKDDDEVEGLSQRIPVIVYSQQHEENHQFSAGPLQGVVRQARSLDRLHDLAALLLHDNVSRLPRERQKLVRDLHASNQNLQGKKVLIVDDDMRNIFALSTVLEEHAMTVVSADNGRDAIALLQDQDDVDIVLMDIMMPEMDGMETMREIRKIGRHKNLPIIAVTAKAMKGDREKCIEAGAWDYLSKPVDVTQMMAALRAWLRR
jgi:CheY-like chemotaxis protein